MRRLPAYIIWICFLPVLPFLSCRTAEKKHRREKVFRINLSSGNLESIDPAFAKDNYSMWITHMVYNTLFETGQQLELIPSLAKSYDVSGDGLVYTIHLKTGIFFHDNPAFRDGRGRAMTASDVVYSFRRIIDPSVASSGAWIFNDRVAAEEPFTAVNDSTVRIRLRAPFRPLPQILSMPYCSIVPREVAEQWGKDFRSHPCGTGPFRFVHWDEGNVLVLHKNEHYWERDSAGSRLPYVDAVQVGFVDSKATEFLLFLQGKLDFVNGVDGTFKDLLLSKNGRLKKEFRDKFNLSISTYLNTEYIGMLTDTANPVMTGAATRSRLVRQAISYAVDRRKIVTYFRNGAAIPATSGFIPPGIPGFDSTGSYGYDYDPAKARALLAEAGYPNGKRLAPVRIVTPDNFLDIVNFIVTQLQDIGINASAEVMQPNLVKQQMSRSQALMFRAQWIADYPDGETYMAVFHSGFPAPPNYTRFSDPWFDALYRRSMNAPDTLRWKLYRQMDSLAMSYAPLIPVYYDRLLHFTQKNVHGFRSNPMNLIDVKTVEIRD